MLFFLNQIINMRILSIILTIVFALIIVILFVLITNRTGYRYTPKEQMKKYNRYFMIFIIILLVICTLVYIFSFYRKYEINNKRVNLISATVKLYEDKKKQETEIIHIKTNDIKFITDNRYEEYYINLSTAGYIVPIKLGKKLDSLLYTNGNINEIVLYKQTKILKSINGTELEDLSYNLNNKEFIKLYLNKNLDNNYDINIKLLKESGIIEIKPSRYTLDDLASNDNILLCIYNEKNILTKKRKIDSQLDGRVNKIRSYVFEDGRYRMCICNLVDEIYTEISNSIIYEVNNNRITDIIVK